MKDEEENRPFWERTTRRSSGPGDFMGPVVGALKQGAVLLDRYRLELPRGRGGFGLVWKATDMQLKKHVALKFLSEILANDRASLADLRKEASVMLDLTHESIVRIMTMHSDGNMAFLVLEYLSGPDLSEVLQRRKELGERGLEPDEALWLLQELAPGLDYAHQNAVTHRDIKPSNILLTSDPGSHLKGDKARAKLADFGIAFVGQTSLSHLTGYRPSGTLPFMSPEILRGHKPTPAS